MKGGGQDEDLGAQPGQEGLSGRTIGGAKRCAADLLPKWNWTYVGALAQSGHSRAFALGLQPHSNHRPQGQGQRQGDGRVAA